MSSPSSADGSRRGAIGVAAGGLLIGLGGISHPRVDTSLEFDQGLAGMFESSMWTASHVLTMAGFVVLAVSLALLAAGAAWTPRLRAIGRLAAVAAAFAAAESLPHLLAASDLDAIQRGEATSLADLHTTLQAISTPAVGLSLAALAVVGARTGALHGGRVPTALAVAGGLAFALAGPAIAISESSTFSPLFAGSAGLAVWAVAAGVSTARRTSRGMTGLPRADHGHELTPAAGRAA